MQGEISTQWVADYSLKGNIVFEQETTIGEVCFSANLDKCNSNDPRLIPQDGELEISATSLIQVNNPIDAGEALMLAVQRIRYTIASMTYTCQTQVVLGHFYVRNVSTSMTFSANDINRYSFSRVDVNLTSGLVELCQTDSDAYDVLALLNSKVSPFELVVLNKVLEIIEPDFKNPQFAAKDEIKNFTGAVNVRRQVGLLASRHGHDRWDVGKNVMKKEECIAFVTNLVDAWLEHKRKTYEDEGAEP